MSIPANTDKGRKLSQLAAISLFGVLVAVFSFAILPSVATALDTGLSYGTITGLSSQDIRITIMKIVRVLLGLVGIIALVIIVYAGFLWMTSAGNAEQIDKAKRTLRNAAIGLLIIFLAFAIVSFISRALEGSLGIGRPPGGIPPGQDCDNCDTLGAGIIESVYPIPGQRDVPRNTNIIVTFKVNMDPTSIISDGGAGCTNDTSFSGCDGTLRESGDNGPVLIYENAAEESGHINGDRVRVRTTDRRSFVFDPLDLLGNSDTDTRYAVKLTNAIQQSNGDNAFQGLKPFFLWRFWVGTLLDIDPPEVATLFPAPDYRSDNYNLQEAAAAQGSLVVNQLPQTLQQANLAFDRISPPGFVCAAGDPAAGQACDPDSGGLPCASAPACVAFAVDPQAGMSSQRPYNGTD